MGVMSRSACAAFSLWLVAMGVGGAEAPLAPDPRQVMFYPPAESALWPKWREALTGWRADARRELKYDDALYRRPEFDWAQRNFTCGFVMLWDEMLWNWREGRFTVERFLDDGLKRFGGYDSLVLWHAYPRIGFDERNQFDFYRDMPGGLAGLRDLVRRLHERNVRVFVDYNPWDRGTRREEKGDLETLADLVKAIEADGTFLDTLHGADARFRELLDAARPGVVLESELALDLAAIHSHHHSWGQWGGAIRRDGPVGVARNKWFERRHMHHLIERWAGDHTPELHAAWMNGTGMLVWENVFGQMRLWSPRDQSILRAMAAIQRRFWKHFVAGEWTPLVPVEGKGVYASLWQCDGVRLWTLVNRTNEKAQFRLVMKCGPDEGCWDPATGWAATGQGGELQGIIEPRGIGAVVAGPRAKLGEDFSAFLARQTEMNRRADFDPKTPLLAETLRPVERTKRHTKAALPPGMIAVPAASFDMQVKFTAREVGSYQTPQRRKVELAPFAIDETPVTNAEFARFLRESDYKPKCPENFSWGQPLKYKIAWRLLFCILRADPDAGAPPKGREDHPVVYVGLDDARAYAKWAGKRLPTEEEWQYAAQGPKGLAYPWGNDFDPARCNGGQAGNGTTPVRAFPAGRSPFGLYDLCGNTWEWTESERSDGRTRFCILKGGSCFKAKGSGWYTDGGPQPANLAAKFLLMWPGLDRCATIGFRCVADLEGGNE